MKCIILAGGYATRLYPLTENFPKPLLPVKQTTILDRLVDDVSEIENIDEIVVLYNNKFINIFQKLKNQKVFYTLITLLDDGSTENDNRLGAVKDIAFAIRKRDIRDDILVLAGDNLLDFSLKEFVRYFEKKHKTCVMIHRETSFEKLRKTGVAQIDDDFKIIDMQEKPEEPKSEWAVPPFYIYPTETLDTILNCVDNKKCNLDAPGDFIAWFCEKKEVYAWEMQGTRYDVGTLESYNRVR